MPYIGEFFVSEILHKPVLDKKGEEIGRLTDFVLVPGEVFPRIASLVVTRRKRAFVIGWDSITLFNKRIISASAVVDEIVPGEISDLDLLLCRDLLDKQIVDIDGAKVVRVNDLKLGEVHEHLCLVAADVGLRGLMRRIGFESQGERVARAVGYRIPRNLITWGYLQPVEPKLTRLALQIPRHKVSEMHPADIAHILSEIPPKDRPALLDTLDPETAALTLQEMGTADQAALIDDLDAEYASEIIEHMDPDEAADLLGDLPTEKAHALLQRMEEEDAQEVEELLAHDEDTAGGLMTPEFLALASDLTVRDAIDQVRLLGPDVETVYCIYILDEDERPVGVLSLRDLIMALPHQSLGEIMTSPVKTIPADAEEKRVCQVISKYGLHALPVVDEEERLLGIITMDDVLYRMLHPSEKKRRRR